MELSSDSSLCWLPVFVHLALTLALGVTVYDRQALNTVYLPFVSLVFPQALFLKGLKTASSLP